MKRITFTIGTEKRWNGKPIFRDVAKTWSRQACLSVARIFGGYTATEATGGWVDENGKLIEERSLVIVGDDLSGHVTEETINGLAAHLRDLFGQECVLVSVVETKGGLV